jgi:hypothetical protein
LEHNGALESFYDQQYTYETVYEGWYYVSASSSNVDLLWANFNNLYYSSVNEINGAWAGNKEGAMQVAWDYTEEGVDLSSSFGGYENFLANQAGDQAEANIALMPTTYTLAQQGPPANTAPNATPKP